jgi:hypothetical protein
MEGLSMIHESNPFFLLIVAMLYEIILWVITTSKFPLIIA